MSRLKRLLVEAHQRSLWQALLVYLGASFGVLGAVDLFIDYFGSPRWLFWVAFALLVTGLPVVIVISLAKEEVYGDDVLAEDAEAAAEEDRRLRVLTWRTAGLSLISALALWGVVAAVLLVLGVRVLEIGAAGIPVSPNRVAVLPFEYRGSEESDYLGEGVAEILSRSIDGAGELAAVDPFALLKYVQREHDALDPEQGAEIARHFGAGLFILGAILEAGGSLRASATLYDLRSRRRADAEAVVAEEAEVDKLTHELSRQLLVESSGDAPERLTRAGAATAQSFDAMKAYLQGEAWARAGKYDSALVAYQRAVDVDTTFALAYYRLASNVWAGGVWRDRALIESARRFSERLSWRDSLLIEAFHAWVHNAYDEAEEIYGRLLNRHPDELDAWVYLVGLLSDVAVHRGRPMAELRNAAERAVALDPHSILGNLLLSAVAAFEGDSATVVASWERSLKAQPEGAFVVHAQAVLASLRGDAGELEKAIADLRAGGPLNIRLTAQWITARADDIPTARRVAELLTEPPRPRGTRFDGHRRLARLELARGRWAAAQDEFAAAYLLDPEPGTWILAAATPATFVPRADVELAALRDSLAAWRPEPERISRLFSLGLLTAQLGEAEQAEAMAAELEGSQAAFADRHPYRTVTFYSNLALTVRAQAAASQGRYEEALHLLEQVEPTTDWRAHFLYFRQERWLRAEVLYALGRYEEALPWYAAFGLEYFADQPYVAPARFRMGDIHEQLGNPGMAARHYSRFLKRWEGCDPELQPWVEQAQRALERLTGEY
ncbi:MAG: hypothetical protein JSW46_06400 [Gemmatimonadota bacterium]|nr:MAG: hypothetical protein JSW46_06400 [Gemmatimonadota bacterium]